MKLRITVAASVLVAIAGTAEAQDLAYVPGTFTYRMNTELHQKQDMMGQIQEMDRKASQHVTVQLDRRTRDTLGFAITIDSSETDSPEMQAALSKLVGKTVTGTVSPRGKVLSFVAPTDSTSSESDFRNVRQFFVRLPDAATRGASVVDTVSDSFDAQGLTIQQQAVMTSTVAGDTTINGENAIILERTGTVSMTGQGEQGGSELTLEGTGTVTGKLYVSAKGGLLGGRMENSSEITVAVLAANMTIPISQTSTSIMERVSAK
ncbi:MAG TPA: hypothetical protein VMM77_08145 [Gemmatimonadaceae bacterium]|nr:hypothetical protein [Gemmatimonadaceae bacterium]